MRWLLPSRIHALRLAIMRHHHHHHQLTNGNVSSKRNMLAMLLMDGCAAQALLCGMTLTGRHKTAFKAVIQVASIRQHTSCVGSGSQTIIHNRAVHA
jgi:phosphotransacetylase